jgi:hypothetical protein
LLDRCNQIEDAAYDFVDYKGSADHSRGRIHAFAGPMIFSHAGASKPISTAIHNWANSVFDLMLAHIATLESEGVDAWDDSMVDFSSCGEMRLLIMW